MGNDKTDDLVKTVLQGMGLALLSLGTDDSQGSDLELGRGGELIHLKVRDSKGKLAFHVSGHDSEEVGRQLGLACLHKVSVEHLDALHLRPLNQPARLQTNKSS